MKDISLPQNQLISQGRQAITFNTLADSLGIFFPISKLHAYVVTKKGNSEISQIKYSRPEGGRIRIEKYRPKPTKDCPCSWVSIKTLNQLLGSYSKKNNQLSDTSASRSNKYSFLTDYLLIPELSLLHPPPTWSIANVNSFQTTYIFLP